MICACGHSKFIHPFGGECQVWACTCTGIDLDPDPYRTLPDCRCGHSAWVHLNEEGVQVRRCPGLRDGPPCGCARYSPGPRIRNAKICLCGHFVTDHGHVDKIGILEPAGSFMSPGAAFFIHGNFRRGPIAWGCTLCGCQGDGRNPPRPVLCCGLEEDHQEGLGCR